MSKPRKHGSSSSMLPNYFFRKKSRELTYKKAQINHGTSNIQLPLLCSQSGGVCWYLTAWHLGNRKEGDSNPRYPFGYARLPSVDLKPLGHLSVQIYIVCCFLSFFKSTKNYIDNKRKNQQPCRKRSRLLFSKGVAVRFNTIFTTQAARYTPVA